jgi:hypothetical protein
VAGGRGGRARGRRGGRTQPHASRARAAAGWLPGSLLTRRVRAAAAAAAGALCPRTQTTRSTSTASRGGSRRGKCARWTTRTGSSSACMRRAGRARGLSGGWPPACTHPWSASCGGELCATRRTLTHPLPGRARAPSQEVRPVSPPKHPRLAACAPLVTRSSRHHTGDELRGGSHAGARVEQQRRLVGPHPRPKTCTHRVPPPSSFPSLRALCPCLQWRA